MIYRKVWGLILACALTAAMITGCGGGSAVSTNESAQSTEERAADKDSAAEENADEAQEETEAAPEEAAPVNSDDTKGSASAPIGPAVDCTFVLEGKQYSMPLNINDLLADGWTTKANLDEELGGYTSTWLNLDKEGLDKNITVDMVNGSGNSKKRSDCNVSRIKVTLSMLDSISFELGNGLKPGDPQESVIEKMGQPTNTYEFDTYTEFVYGDNAKTGKISFLWGKEDPSWCHIQLEYVPAEETTTFTEVGNASVQQARSGLLRFLLKYTDESNRDNVCQYGNGFLINDQFFVTCGYLTKANEDDTEFFLDMFGIDEATFNDRLSICVLTSDGYRKAEVVMYDDTADFAILKLESGISGYKAIPLRRSDNLIPPEGCYTLGFLPAFMDEDGVITYSSEDASVFSGKIESIETVDGVKYILSNANVYDYFSGGPLVDENGNVIGIIKADLLPDELGKPRTYAAITTDILCDTLESMGIPYTNASDSSGETSPEITEP